MSIEVAILALIGAVIAACVMTSYAYEANTLFKVMVAEVNAKLPLDQQFPDQRVRAAFGGPGRFRRAYTLHRQFYPGSELPREEKRLTLRSAAWLIVGASLLYLSMRGLGIEGR
jgi:hypothetical protein